MPSPYACGSCDNQFKRRIDLRDHRRSNHPVNRSTSRRRGRTDMIHICQTCEKTFNRRVDLREHRKAEHARIGGPYICHACGKTSSRRYELYQHTRSHYQCYPFTCPICYARLKWKHSITRHSCIRKVAQAFGIPVKEMTRMIAQHQVMAEVTDPLSDAAFLSYMVTR